MVSGAKDLVTGGFAWPTLSAAQMNVHTQIDFGLLRFMALIEINSCCARHHSPPLLFLFLHCAQDAELHSGARFISGGRRGKVKNMRRSLKIQNIGDAGLLGGVNRNERRVDK